MTWVCRIVPVAVVVAAAACSPAEDSSSTAVEEAPAGPVVLGVTIIDGEVTPRGARVNLKVGQSLTLSIRSDVDEQIHVHTDPEKTFRVKAGSHRRVTFSVDRPGAVAVEVHHLDVVVAEVLVRK